MIQNAAQLSQRSIADTINSVFREPEYSTEPLSFVDYVFAWLDRALAAVARFLSENSTVGPYIRWAIIVIAALIVGRILFALLLHYRPRTFGVGTRFSAQRTQDPWAIAQRYAASGDYSSAAHSLYSAAVISLARSGLLALHDSKTAGDYLRELRGKPRRDQFASFAQLYEVLMYGRGSCNAEEYQTLLSMANPFRNAFEGRE